MNLASQIIALIFMVGGVVVSAYAIPDPWRKRAVVGFSFLGLLNLALIILTYENTPDVPHFADLGPFIWRGSITIWARIVAVAENHILQTVAAAQRESYWGRPAILDTKNGKRGGPLLYRTIAHG